MTKELKLKLEAQIRDYKKKGRSIRVWRNELGDWQDWMEEFREDEGEHLTEDDVISINESLEEMWHSVRVDAIYDLFLGEFIKNFDKEHLTDADAKTKEYIKEQYLYDRRGSIIDSSEPRKLLDKTYDLEGICEVLNLAEFGYPDEKRYIVKRIDSSMFVDFCID